MLSVKDGPDEIKAAVLAIKRVERDLRNKINRATRAELNPVWRSLVQLHATTTLQTKVLAKGARIRAGNPPTALAATSKRRLAGGLNPAEHWRPFEFGSRRERTRTYTSHSPKGTPYTVHKRHTARQFKPVNKSGYVVFQAMADIGPRMASLWVQLIVKSIMDAAEGKQ